MDTQYGKKRRCRVIFELDKKMADNQPFTASKTYTGHTSIANTIRYLSKKKMALNVESLMQEIDL